MYLSWLLKVLVFTMSHIFEIFSFVDACPFNFHGCTDFLHDFRVPAWSCFLDTLKTHQKIYRDTSVYWLFLTGLDDGKGGCVFLSFSMFGYAFTIGQSCNVLFLNHIEYTERSYPHGFRLICTVFVTLYRKPWKCRRNGVQSPAFLVNYTYICRIVSTYVWSMAFCCYRKYLDKESKEWNHIIRRNREYSERQHGWVVHSQGNGRLQRWDIGNRTCGRCHG